MKMKRHNYGEYVSPAVEVLELHSESVLCTSSEEPWYLKSGDGNFDYTIEEDEQFG